MQIGGTLINGLVRVLVVVGILAAVSYFVIRPVLDTTEKVSSGINDSIQQSIDEANQAFEQTNVKPQTQKILTRKIKNVPPSKIPKLQNCITAAGTDINQINRCINRYSN